MPMSILCNSRKYKNTFYHKTHFGPASGVGSKYFLLLTNLHPVSVIIEVEIDLGVTIIASWSSTSRQVHDGWWWVGK